MTLRILLPWPESSLSPNGRTYWRAQAIARKRQRRDAYLLCKSAGAEHFVPVGAVKVSLKFHPPDRRVRDLDNCFASMKSAIDGLADAIGVNDKEFTYQMAWGEMIEKQGGVSVEVSV